jgi:hypothetical protein
MLDGSPNNLNEVEFYRDEDKGFGNIDRLIHLKQAGTIGQLLQQPRRFGIVEESKEPLRKESAQKVKGDFMPKP